MFAQLIEAGPEGMTLGGCSSGRFPVDGACTRGTEPNPGYCGNGLAPHGGWCSAGYN